MSSTERAPAGEFLLHTIDLRRLAAATADERQFLLVGGHFFNELMTFNKLLSWAIPPPEESADIDVRGMQALSIARVLAGKTHEASVHLNQIYGPLVKSGLLVDSSVPESLKQINRYFGRANLISDVRNQFAFHFSREQIASPWEALSEEGGFDLLIGDAMGNNYHRGAELCANSAMLAAINSKDRGQALGAFFEAVQAISRLVEQFLDGVILALLLKYLGQPHTWPKGQNVGVRHRFGDVRIPCFTAIERPADRGLSSSSS